MLIESAKSFGDKVGSFFETKEKTNAEVSAEKVEILSEAIASASSEVDKKFGENSKDVKSDAKKLAADGSKLQINCFFTNLI